MMRQLKLCLKAALLQAAVFVVEASPADSVPEAIQVLFLGDHGPHRPAERFAQLDPVLAERGIKLTYTDRPEDLTQRNLAQFEVVAVYANQTTISQAQERALKEFVEIGRGLVAIHCASDRFHNSTRHTEAAGGQLHRHVAGLFSDTIVEPNHPIMRGLEPLESWDETCVHHRHHPDRVVLAQRVGGDRAEPWTWVRNQGKGRVFYTAWGHDHRTWSKPGFHQLIERGIRWTAAAPMHDLIAHPGPAPFECVEAPERLPNYVPGAEWGTLGEPIHTMQKPLSPEESLKRYVTHPEFDIELFAAEPDIVKPIWLAWDERGRLWIAETVDYPNDLQPPGQGNDRITILEDTTGDGRADRFTVFADKLSIPTSFTFANGGLIVVQAPHTLFLKDTTGDDRADVREVLFTGWRTHDTHAGPSNLRWGLDNWIWGVSGYAGFEGTAGGKPHRFAMGFFRFKPDGSELEFIRSSNNNTWGLGISEGGIIFGSTANNNPSMYMPIPNRYYEAVRGWSASRMESIANSSRIFPITPKVRQVDWHGRYTAGAGHALYTARNFPQEYWDRVAFVAEPTGQLLGQFIIEPFEADFLARNARNFLASDDEWASPIAAEVGPDGALWMLDWYSYVIQHNPTPAGFDTGKGNAYVTALRETRYGRIHRISWKQARPVEPLRLDRAAPEELVVALRNDNQLWRLHAQRLLVERGRKDVVPALLQLVRDTSVDEIGLNAAAIHGLWTLHGLRALDGSDAAAITAVTAALHHPSPGVRRAAVGVLPRSAAGLAAILDGKVLEDRDAQVRLAALLAVAEMPFSEAAGAAVYAILKQSSNLDDPWIPDAATAAAARHDAAFLRTVLADSRRKEAQQTLITHTTADASFEQDKEVQAVPAAAPPIAGRAAHVVQIVTGHYARRAPVDTIVPLLISLKTASPGIARSILDGLVAGWPVDTVPNLSAEQENALVNVMLALAEETRDGLLTLAQRWGRIDIFADQIDDITRGLKRQVADAALADEQRAAASRRWVVLEDRPETANAILEQVTIPSSPALANGLISALAEGRHADIGRSLTARWTHFGPAARRTAVSTLLRRPEWTVALLDAIADETVPQADLAQEHWQQLRLHPDKTVARRAETLAENPANPDMEKLLEELRPVARMKGDPARGREVYEAECASCHTFNGRGGAMGPDLTGIGARDRVDILIDIIDPNRSVESNYRLWIATTWDGQTFSGRLDAETQTTVEITDTVETHVIQRADLVELRASPLSIMPDGFEKLPREDLAALLEYLTAAQQQEERKQAPVPKAASPQKADQ